MRWFREHYLSSENDALDPRASPLRADDLTGMPPTYLALAGFDPLTPRALPTAPASATQGCTRPWPRT